MTTKRKKHHFSKKLQVAKLLPTLSNKQLQHLSFQTHEQIDRIECSANIVVKETDLIPLTSIPRPNVSVFIKSKLEMFTEEDCRQHLSEGVLGNESFVQGIGLAVDFINGHALEHSQYIKSKVPSNRHNLNQTS